MPTQKIAVTVLTPRPTSYWCELCNDDKTTVVQLSVRDHPGFVYICSDCVRQLNAAVVDAEQKGGAK